MALVIKDRVKETTTTTGTATYQLAGAVSGSEGFIQVGDGNTTYYVCTDNTSFEIGIGTFTDASPDTLARTSILQAKDVPNGTTDQAVDWSSGTRTIFCTYPADKAVFEDASNNINGTFVGNITGDVTGNAATATALETGRTINGTSFDGTGNITVTAAAGTLTGGTLNSGVTASSLTSVGTLASLTTSGDITVGDDLTVNGGVIDLKTNSGSVAQLKFYCESANAHAQTLQAQPHARAASNALTLPGGNIIGDSDATLLSDTGTQTVTNKSIDSDNNTITNIVNADIKSSAAIADSKLATISTAGKVAISALDIDGGTDIGAALVDADEIIVDDGGGGTNRRSDMSRVKTYVADVTLTTAAQTNITSLGTLTGLTTSGVVDITNTTDSSDATGDTGALRVEGGVSIAKKLFVGTDADIDGTLEADAMTLNGTDITTTATLSTGISNGNVLVATSGIADNDFLKVDGTSIEGRSSSEVLSDIGGQASLTFGISNTNAVKIDSSSVADDEYARFTANGLESRSASETRGDIGLGTAAVLDTGISNTNVPKFTSGVADNDFLRVDGTAIEGRSASEVLSDIGGQASLTFGISNTNAVKIDHASVADDDFARFTANGLEGRSASEVLSDIGATTATAAANEATALAIALG